MRDGLVGKASTVPGEPSGEGAIVLMHPDGRMDMEAGVRLGAHAGGLILIEQLQSYERPEHGAAKRFGQSRGIVHRPRHKGPVGPEAAVGDEQVRMRISVAARAMRLQTGDDAHRELALPRQRADGRRDGAGGDAGDLAEQAAAIETVGAQPLGDGEYHLAVRHGREECRMQPLRPDGQSPAVANRAEVAALAGEGQ